MYVSDTSAETLDPDWRDDPRSSFVFALGPNGTAAAIAGGVDDSAADTARALGAGALAAANAAVGVVTGLGKLTGNAISRAASLGRTKQKPVHASKDGHSPAGGGGKRSTPSSARTSFAQSPTSEGSTANSNWPAGDGADGCVAVACVCEHRRALCWLLPLLVVEVD